ncbi:MAG TPA: hypothetical protein VFB84_20955 [Micromonosporaceae bacterium]|nr:hypothetical protein [Micromonosporaceae bacterium]
MPNRSSPVAGSGCTCRTCGVCVAATATHEGRTPAQRRGVGPATYPDLSPTRPDPPVARRAA